MTESVLVSTLKQKKNGLQQARFLVKDLIAKLIQDTHPS